MPSEALGEKTVGSDRQSLERQPAVEAGSVPETSGTLDDEPTSLSGAAIATRFGGLFYTLHALEDLDLFSLYDRAAPDGAATSPWRTLDLVGRGLLAHRFEAISDDPVWRLLAELAGELPARDRSAAPPVFRAPGSWRERLRAIGSDFHWAATTRRLSVWSATGMLIADRPREGSRPSVEARRELDRFLAGVTPDEPAQSATKSRSFARRPSASAPRADLSRVLGGCDPVLSHLTECVVPAVRRRLLLALGADVEGCDPVAGSAGDPVDRLLLRPATVHLTPSHVDLVFGLESADLEVRRAGLDRNPGWVAELGRVFTFHFR